MMVVTTILNNVGLEKGKQWLLMSLRTGYRCEN